MLLSQWWLDLAFLLWAVDPQVVAPLLPRGVRPDVIDGQTYVGLIAFRMHRVGWFRLPGVPWLGSFPETNVRLYSVDDAGRRGVVFLSLDASRLLPVLTARIGFRLPYIWSRMSVQRGHPESRPEPELESTPDSEAETIPRAGTIFNYTSRRHWPGRRSATSRISIRVGEPIESPSPAEHFMTARWGLHYAPLGRALYLPNEHPRWALCRAELLDLDENLVAAAGLPAPVGPPDSVLYAAGVPVQFGPPVRS